jgi:hypothetical protein
VICNYLKLPKFRPSVFDQLWQLITSATEVQGGRIVSQIEGLDGFFEWLKPRTCRPKIWLLLAHMKLAKNPEFHTFSSWKSSKSWLEFVLLRARLRRFLTVLVEMSFPHQSNIDLQILYMEFFCNLSVSPWKTGTVGFYPPRYGRTLPAVGPDGSSFSHTK